MFGFKRSHSDHTDEQLVQLMRTGNSEAFNQLYSRYNQRLLYYFYRMLGNSEEKARDFLQDIFIKLIDKADTFDITKRFSTWIFSIAHNMCKNEYRRMEVRINSAFEALDNVYCEQEDLAEDIEVTDLEQFIRDLFEELDDFDEIHKTVFILHYREDFSLKEIGQILDISEGTVKSRLFYTRKRLSERLVKYRKALLLDNL
ncbi:MAG TPA: RNA polymerase sigma factor [Bacteroidales bacterium]